jgi:glycosyltransferase involved in cell wall biosynthesis
MTHGELSVSGIGVSVIIPAYNRAAYINQTVDSVLEQTYKNLELIVVDDGSTDGTFEKLQEYGDRITLLTHEGRANKGQAASINLGLRKATGKYVAILDSDDFWEPNKLDIQVNFLEKQQNVGLVYCNGYGVDADGLRYYDFYSEDPNEQNDPNRVLLDCYILLPQNSLVRKSVYDEVGFFNEEYRSAQDHDMLIRISEVCKFAYLPDFVFNYRRHEDSISAKKQDVRWTTGFKILEAASKRYPYKSSTIRKRKAVLNFRLGQVFIKQGKYMKALAHLIKAGFLDPLRSLKVLFGKEAVN